MVCWWWWQSLLEMLESVSGFVDRVVDGEEESDSSVGKEKKQHHQHHTSCHVAPDWLLAGVVPAPSMLPTPNRLPDRGRALIRASHPPRALRLNIQQQPPGKQQQHKSQSGYSTGVVLIKAY